MECALINPNTKYCLEKGAKCYVAVDNVRGGETITAVITGSCQVEFRGMLHEGYKIRYEKSDPPYGSVEIEIPKIQVFDTLEAVAAARKADRSMQLHSIERSCCSPEGLVRFLLSRAELDEDEKAAVLKEACRMELYNDHKKG